MKASVKGKRLLGINGLGRIGKLTLWNFLYRKHFDGLVINMGREVGKSVDDLVQVIETDSTYGTLGKFLYGYTRKPEIKVLEACDKRFARYRRRAGEGPPGSEKSEGYQLAQGRGAPGYRHHRPVHGPGLLPPISRNGSLRGHLEGGAEKVINSSPFKIKDKSLKMPDDSACLIYGINHTGFRSGPASSHLGRFLHHHRAGAHDQAAPGNRGNLADPDRFHVHHPCRDQYPERARCAAESRGHRSAQKPFGHEQHHPLHNRLRQDPGRGAAGNQADRLHGRFGTGTHQHGFPDHPEHNVPYPSRQGAATGHNPVLPQQYLQKGGRGFTERAC